MTNRNGVVKAFGELVGDAEDQIKQRMIMAAYEVLQKDAPQLADEVVLRGVQALSEGDEVPKGLLLWFFEADRKQQTSLIERGASLIEVDPLKRWSVAFDAHPEVAERLKDEIALIVKRTRVVSSRKVRRG